VFTVTQEMNLYLRFRWISEFRRTAGWKSSGQTDRAIPCFSSVLEQTLTWYTNFLLHCMLLVQPSKHKFQNIRPNAAIALLSKFCQMQASDYQNQNKKPKINSKFSANTRLISSATDSNSSLPITSKRTTLTPASTKDERARPGNLQSHKHCPLPAM
jgi:hypothetical protein